MAVRSERVLHDLTKCADTIRNCHYQPDSEHSLRRDCDRDLNKKFLCPREPILSRSYLHTASCSPAGQQWSPEVSPTIHGYCAICPFIPIGQRVLVGQFHLMCGETCSRWRGHSPRSQSLRTYLSGIQLNFDMYTSKQSTRAESLHLCGASAAIELKN